MERIARRGIDPQDGNVEIATSGLKAPPRNDNAGVQAGQGKPLWRAAPVEPRNDMEWDCHDGPAEEPWGPVGVQGPQGDCGVADTCKHVVELKNVIENLSDQIIFRDEEIDRLREKIIRQEALKDAYQWQVQGLLDRMTMRNA